MVVFYLDEQSIRRQQCQALVLACERLRVTLSEGDLPHAPAHSCAVMAAALCDALEGAGLRFVDREAATDNVALALWEGLAVISADAQAADAEHTTYSPVFSWLAPVLHSLAAITESVGSAATISVSDQVRSQFLEQLQAEASPW
jgi:hypothetical protein